MDLLNPATEAKSTVSSMSSSISVQSAAQNPSSNFAAVLSDTMGGNSQSSNSGSSNSQNGSPSGDRSTWAEMAMIDPSTGQTYYTPVNANVEAALQDAVAKHIPGFDIDELSDQTYINKAAIRMNTASTNSVTASTLSSTTPAIVSTANNGANNNYLMQSTTSTGLSLAHANASLINNILNSVLNNSSTNLQSGSTTSAVSSELLASNQSQSGSNTTAASSSDLISNLLTLASRTATVDTTSTLDKLLSNS
jgi:hypothetical protein